MPDLRVTVGEEVIEGYRESLGGRTKNELAQKARRGGADRVAIAAAEAGRSPEEALTDLLVKERRKRLEGTTLHVWMRDLGLWQQRWRLEKEIDRRRATLHARTWLGRLMCKRCCGDTDDDGHPKTTMEQ